MSAEQEPALSGEISLDRAEFGGGASLAAACVLCKQSLATEYWEVNGQVACGSCKGQFEAALAGASGVRRFGKALLFGLIGGALGSLVWFAVVKLFNLELGLIAILIGYLVAKGVRKAIAHSGGVGYQVLAVVLTYLSIGWNSCPKDPASTKF